MIFDCGGRKEEGREGEEEGTAPIESVKFKNKLETSINFAFGYIRSLMWLASCLLYQTSKTTYNTTTPTRSNPQCNQTNRLCTNVGRARWNAMRLSAGWGRGDEVGIIWGWRRR